MDVTPVFADSLGAKSFCFRVDTDETSVLIDPGAAPFPEDHPTMSTEGKEEALHRAWAAIDEAAEGVQHVAITHWHGDHFSLPDDGVDFEALFGGRVLWIKDPRTMINPGQERKAHRFLDALTDAFGGSYGEGELPSPTGVTVRAADDRSVIYRDTEITFSRPLPHGRKGSQQGYVLAVCVDDGEHTFVDSSDVQGPASKAAYTWIDDRDPTHLALDGPPSYLIGRYDVTERSVEKAIDRGEMLLDSTEPEWCVYDHHICREPGYRDRCPGIWERGARTVKEMVE